MIPANSNNVTERNSSTPVNNIKPRKFATVTRAAYQEILKTPDAKSNLKIKRLAAGRAKLWDAKMVIDAALADHNPQVSKRPEDAIVYNRLRAISKNIDRAWAQYPLTLENK